MKIAKTALVLAILSFGLFSLFAWDRLPKQSTDPHFVLQATAFLQGRLQLPSAPPHQNDWASFYEIQHTDGSTYRGIYLASGSRDEVRPFQTLNGPTILLQRRDVVASSRKYFVSFPPFPALLMTPFVAIFGESFNDVLFTVVMASINVGLFFWLLSSLSSKGLSQRALRDNVLLTLLLAFGTVHFWCAILGQVWFTALIVGVGLTTLYLLATIHGKSLLAGIFLACAMATRPHLAFASVFFYLPVLWPKANFLCPNPSPLPTRLKALVLFSIPMVIAGVLLMWANVHRFADPFEFGHRYLAAGSIPRIRDHGLFASHFLARNLHAAFTLLPRLQNTAPYLQISKHGMSLFLTTPAFLFLFFSKQRTPFLRLLWITVAVLAIPQFFYQNTGYEQFGYRFSLDYTPYLVAILAVGGRPLSILFLALSFSGMVVNGFGAVIFKRFPQFFGNHFLG